ncbi:hypothetical protein [Bacteroides sp. 519]|uniref:hypothetical protein n=1 Tax=Bacteroides sp. 519 TaxID=2302937 RepID=UPI0013CF73CE|nr:hypothetical protein [Bacteroides sp. 519]NDV58713.1 hypothetical protein [Bacteroides sp. 519]
MKNKKSFLIIALALLAIATLTIHFAPNNSKLAVIDTEESEQEASYIIEEPFYDEESEQEVPDDTTHLAKFKPKYWFEDFNTEVYKGEPAAPDFTNNPFANDQEFVDFITKGCEKNGVNFGGHYTIIEKGCGAMCEHIFIVDRKSGKIFTHITLKKNDGEDGKYGYRYCNDSRLLIANSNLLNADNYYITAWRIEPELYKWTGKDFKFIQ